MKSFIIKQIDKDYAKYLIFGITVESPLFQLFEICEDITISDGDSVIFDQLLQTGNAANRFLTLSFSNGEFDFGSAKNIDLNIVDAEVKTFACNFLRENIDILKYSILLSEQKDAILSGRNI